MLLVVLFCIQQIFIEHLLCVGLLFLLSRSWQISTAHLNLDLLRADFGRGCFRDSPTVAIFVGFPLLPPLRAWAHSPRCWPREKPITVVSCLTAPLLVSSAWLCHLHGCVGAGSMKSMASEHQFTWQGEKHSLRVGNAWSQGALVSLVRILTTAQW